MINVCCVLPLSFGVACYTARAGGTVFRKEHSDIFTVLSVAQHESGCVLLIQDTLLNRLYLFKRTCSKSKMVSTTCTCSYCLQPFLFPKAFNSMPLHRWFPPGKPLNSISILSSKAQISLFWAEATGRPFYSLEPDHGGLNSSLAVG
jgi:hypothetical protein